MNEWMTMPGGRDMRSGVPLTMSDGNWQEMNQVRPLFKFFLWAIVSIHGELAHTKKKQLYSIFSIEPESSSIRRQTFFLTESLARKLAPQETPALFKLTEQSL